MTNTIYHTLRSAGQSHGANLALVQHEDSFERTLTVHAVYQLADAIGSQLREHGLKPGSRVVLLAETRIESIIASLAIFAAGGVVVLVDPNLDASDTDLLIKKSDPCLVFSPEHAIERIGHSNPAIPVISLSHDAWIAIGTGELSETINQITTMITDQLSTHRLSDQSLTLCPPDEALILFTSGTTGIAISEQSEQCVKKSKTKKPVLYR